MKPINPDVNFPKRPQHPDFFRLSEVVCENDRLAEAGQAEALMRGIVDLPSLAYMADQRLLRVALLGLDPRAAYFDAFFAGVAYAHAKTKAQNREEPVDAQG